MVDIAEQCMTAVIGTIKQNPELEKEQATALVEQFYPGEGEFRLQLYVDAMYGVGAILASEYEVLRLKITDTSVEDLVRIMPQVRIVADELLKPHLQTLALQARKAELETLLAGPSPVKTEPDVEAMNFWNENSMQALEWQMAEAEYADQIRLIGD